MYMAKVYTKQMIQVLTLSLSLAIFGCGKDEKKAAASQARPTPTVYVEKPEKRSLELWDSFTARLEGEKSVEVRARVSGYLEKICFNDGQFVKEGDVLFVIDPRPFQAVVNQCKAKIAEIEARIKLAENNFKRAEELIKSDAISNEVLETRRCDLLSAKASLMSAQAQLNEANLNLEFTVIKAPISGYVNKRYVDAGNLINASGTLLSTVVSRDVIYAYFTIGEHYLLGYQKSGFFKKIDSANKKGPEARIRLLGENDFSHKGKVTYMQNSLDVGNLELRAEFDNKDMSLIPGVWAKLQMKVADSKVRLLVPESAIGTDLANRFVRVVDENKRIKNVPVRVGEVIGGKQIIEEGLDGSEDVVVNGVQRAIAGILVNPVENAKK